MRISDWSSDVCSSDLVVERAGLQHHDRGKDRKTVIEAGAASGAEEAVDLAPALGAAEDTGGHTPHHGEGVGRQDHGDGEGAGREALAVAAVAAIDAEFGGGRDAVAQGAAEAAALRSEEHTSGLQSLMRSSYAIICLQQIET